MRGGIELWFSSLAGPRPSYSVSSSMSADVVVWFMLSSGEPWSSGISFMIASSGLFRGSRLSVESAAGHCFIAGQYGFPRRSRSSERGDAQESVDLGARDAAQLECWKECRRVIDRKEGGVRLSKTLRGGISIVKRREC
jgi:hypothetical protein